MPIVEWFRNMESWGLGLDTFGHSHILELVKYFSIIMAREDGHDEYTFMYNIFLDFRGSLIPTSPSNLENARQCTKIFHRRDYGFLSIGACVA